MNHEFVELASYFRIRFDDPLHCDLPLKGVRVELGDPRYLELISQIHGPESVEAVVDSVRRIFEVSVADARIVVADLRLHGILVDASQRDPRESLIEHWERRGWLDALHLHLMSRNVAFEDDGASDPGSLHDTLFGALAREETPPPFWKEYQAASRVVLPDGEPLPEDRSFEQVLLARRSNRRWAGSTLSAQRLSTILQVANAETNRLRMIAASQWRLCPRTLLQSAFCATETYVFAFSVDGIDPGLYHYDPRDSTLALVREGLLRDELVRMCAGQGRPGASACAFAITGVFDRYMYRYRHPRAYRTLLINIAELAQKYILTATTFGLSTFITPLFFDEVADELLGVDGYEEALLELVAVG